MRERHRIFLMLAASLLFLVLTISVLDFFSSSRLENVPNVGQATAPLQYYANTLSTPEDLTIGLLRIAKEHAKASFEQKPVLLINAVDVSEKRKRMMLKLMVDDTEGFFKSAMTANMRENLPPEVRKNVEEDIELEGDFEFLIGDDLERGKHKNYFFLDDRRGGKFSLHFAGEEPSLLSGARVRVRGKKVDNSLALQSSSGSDFQALSTAPLVNVTTKKVAVLLINFRNSKAEPYTHDQIRQVTFTGSGSANAYYSEISYGQVALAGKIRSDGDVYGYYTIDYDNVNCSSMYSTWASAARSMAAAQGVDLTGYNSIIYYLASASGCSWWGLGSVGGNPASSWITSTYSLKVVGHELGHNFGAHHSSAYTCTLDGVKVPISNSCTITEYGDPFDIMGNPSNNHFNNFQKGRVGYYDAQSTLTLSTPGTYTVVPIEFATSGVRALRVPKDRDSLGKPINYYYIEYRQPYGFDSYSASSPVVNGVSIRIGRDYNIIDRPLLIDTTATTSSFNDASLLVGQSFTDPAKGITITTLAVSPSEATVRVDFGTIPCTRANPTVTMSPSSQWAYAGGTLNYNLVVRNNDNFECSPSIFTVSTSGTNTAGWTFVTNPQSVSLGPGAQATVVASVTSSSSAAEGYYTLTSTAQNSQASGYQGSASASYNVMGVDTTPPIVKITSPRKTEVPSKGNLKITGTASDDSGIKGVEIFLDSTSVAYCANSGSCQVNLPANSISSGTHTITVRAEDKAPTPNTGAVSMVVYK